MMRSIGSRPVRITGLALAALLAGCGDSATPITGCEPSAGMLPDCRFQNPEDLAVAPGGRRMLVSQMGSMDGSKPGNLALYTPAGDIDVLFPNETVVDDRSWGDPSCPPPAPAAFSPHGIDLVQRRDGRWSLLVVNHGGRESVELFELMSTGPVPALAWRGCAMGPAQAAFNDVVGRADGGFYVTHMYDADSALTAMLKGLVLGSDTGFVYAWSTADGWQPVAGSEGAFPNGIELSDDGSALYINMYLAGVVEKLDLASGEVVAVSAEGGNPDNSTWASDGRLLVATHTDGIFEVTACQELESGSCGFEFHIMALDPDTLEGSALLSNRGAPMGAATVALEMDGALYLGTFAGDRITRVSLSADRR